MTRTDYFTTKFRQIFTKTQIKFTTAKYARKWLAKPDMSFWPQQLNFALWCATTGCGVSREMLFPNSSLTLSKSEPFISFTCTTPRKRSCTRARARTRCQTTQPSTRRTTPTTLPLTSVSVRSLGLTQARTSGLPMGKTTGWGT